MVPCNKLPKHMIIGQNSAAKRRSSVKDLSPFGMLGKLALAGMLIASGTVGVRADGPSSIPIAAAGTPRFMTSRDHVHVIGVMQSGPDALLITLRVDRGFHINAHPASQPYLIPTTLTFAGLIPLRIIYPRALRFQPRFADAPINVYEGTVAITALFPEGALMRVPPPHAKVTVQACTDRICLPPADLMVPE